MNANDFSLRRPKEALLVLRQAVIDTREEDLSLLVAYADALARAESYEESRDVYDKCIALANRTNLVAAQSELLYMSRARVLVKLLPPVPPTDMQYVGVEPPAEKAIPPTPERPIREMMTIPLITSHPAAEPLDPAKAMHFPVEFLPDFKSFSPTTGPNP